jgi:hypothetical protein
MGEQRVRGGLQLGPVGARGLSRLRQTDEFRPIDQWRQLSAQPPDLVLERGYGPRSNGLAVARATSTIGVMV